MKDKTEIINKAIGSLESAMKELMEINELIQEGWISALKFYTIYYEFNKDFQEQLSMIYESAIDEAANEYDEKVIELNGFRITKSEGRTTWNYSTVPEIVQLENKVKELKQKYKNLAIARFDKFEVITEDGEIPVLPVKKEGKPSLTLTKLS